MISGVYTITNIVNNKVYVGYSKDVFRRLSGHKNKLIKNKHHCIHLQRAVNEYGIDNFIFELLVECSIEMLASEENYWANLLNSHNDKFGYNDKPTHPNNRPIQNEASRAKIKEKRALQVITQEHKDSISKSSKGKKLTDEHRYRISISKKGKKLSEEHRKRIQECKPKKIKEIKENYEEIVWDSIKEAAAFHKVVPSTIRLILTKPNYKSKQITSKFYYLNKEKYE